MMVPAAVGVCVAATGGGAMTCGGGDVVVVTGVVAVTAILTTWTVNRIRLWDMSQPLGMMPMTLNI